MAPCSRALRFKSLTVRWAPRICFVPRCAFLSPRPRFLLSYPLFGFCLLSALHVYRSRSRATCHFLRQFLQPSWLDPIFLPFQTVVPTPRPLWLSFMVIHLGASFISHLPFLVLHGSLLSSVGFFFFVCSGFFWSYSSHWTLRFLPQLRRCLPFCPPCSEWVLHTQCRSLMAKVACT